MCIICIDFDKGTLSAKDARRALGEMSAKLDKKHVEEVAAKLDKAEKDAKAP